MKVVLEIKGLDDLRRQMRALPGELTTEATAIVLKRAHDAANATRDAYVDHVFSGNLIRGVRVDTKETSRWGVSVAVRSGAPHAHLFEFGTELRETASGAGRGRMPKPTHPTFVPITQDARRYVMQDQIAMLRKHGFEVRGGFF